VVFDWPYDLRTNGSPVIETLELAPYPAICVLDEFRLLWAILVGRIYVDPLLYFYASGSIVEFVGEVRCLRRDVTYLSDKCELYRCERRF
jgi:hypothetical protein